MKQDIEKIKTALAVLHSAGLTARRAEEVVDGWETQKTAQPSPVDERYVLPEVAPSLEDHFVKVVVDKGKATEREVIQPTILEASKMWSGYSYRLTLAARAWFREKCGMTPSATVTVSDVEKWPGTLHPRSFRVRSDIHIDPRQRAHVVVEAWVSNAGEFFAYAPPVAGVGGGKAGGGKASTDRKKKKSLEDLLKELEGL